MKADWSVSKGDSRALWRAPSNGCGVSVASRFWISAPTATFNSCKGGEKVWQIIRVEGPGLCEGSRLTACASQAFFDRHRWVGPRHGPRSRRCSTMKRTTWVPFGPSSRTTLWARPRSANFAIARPADWANPFMLAVPTISGLRYENSDIGPPLKTSNSATHTPDRLRLGRLLVPYDPRGADR